MWKKWRPRVQIFIILFILGFIAGVICMTVKKEDLIYGTGFMDSYTLSPIKYLDIDGKILLGYVLRQRLLGAVLLMILATTYLGCGATYLFFLWNGIVWGLLCSGCFERYGMKGLIFVAGSTFPQAFFYLPAFLVLAVYVCDLCKVLYFDKNDTYLSKKSIFYRFLIAGIIILSVVIIGCLLESYVNPFLIKFILNLF